MSGLKRHDSMGSSRSEVLLEEISEIDELISLDFEETTDCSQNIREKCLSFGSRKLIDKVFADLVRHPRKRFDSGEYFLAQEQETNEKLQEQKSALPKRSNLSENPTNFEAAPWEPVKVQKNAQPRDFLKVKSFEIIRSKLESGQ